MGSILTTGVDVKVYRSNPLNAGSLPLGRLKKGDVALVVNYFGFVSSVQDLGDLRGTVELIEDHSHDLNSDWAQNSRADWCVASLRKTIPTPDGGVLWSPRKHTLPEPPPLTWEHYLAAKQKQTALEMKSHYLDGNLDGKSNYLECSKRAERVISDGHISGASPWARSAVGVAPVDRWRLIRRSNYKVLAHALSEVRWLKVIQEQINGGTSPFAMILVFRSKEQAQYVRQRLIQSNIYPAILWSLTAPKIEGIDVEDISLSQRLLSIGCDARYDRSDMRRVADTLIKIGELPEQDK